jgi:hypothetical protein
MKKVILVIGLQQLKGRPTKFKLSVISPTEVGEKPERILVRQCVELPNSAVVSGIIAEAKKYIQDNLDLEVSLMNGFYLSHTGDVLRTIDEVDQAILSKIQREIFAYQPA